MVEITKQQQVQEAQVDKKLEVAYSKAMSDVKKKFNEIAAVKGTKGDKQAWALFEEGVQSDLMNEWRETKRQILIGHTHEIVGYLTTFQWHC